jgi:hypothetical protein
LKRLLLQISRRHSQDQQPRALHEQHDSRVQVLLLLLLLLPPWPPPHLCASVLYKSKLPFVVCFNKIDVKPHAFALEWLRCVAALNLQPKTTDIESCRDYDAFREAADAGNTYSHTFVSCCRVESDIARF